jgi:hypothetical protein
MSISALIRVTRPILHRHPGVKRALQNADTALSRLHQSAGCTTLPPARSRR